MASLVEISNSIPKYNEYDHHIQEFDDNYYFEKKNMNDDSKFDDKIDNFYNFITLYKKVEEEDLKKHHFLQGNKFKKGNNFNNSGYSYNVTNYQKQKTSKVWNSHVPKSNDEKLNGLIESYLNKISDESYKKISIEFINELIKIDNMFYFDIITKKIVDKCVMDNKYQHLYIQLCNKIWSNRQIHYHMAVIKEENKKYTWSCKYENVNKVYGPFGSEMDAKMNIFYELNFKKYFMNYLQELFINKNVNFSHIDNDEEFFLHKRQFMVIIEILGIMYSEKFIPVDILHLVVMKLFHMNDINMTIESIEIDGILQIFKIMNQYKEKNHISDYFDLPIFEEYYNYITQIEKLETFNMRTKYFLTDCKDILKGKKKSVSSNKLDNIVENETNILEKVLEEKQKNNVAQMIQLYNQSNEDNKNAILYDVIYRYCESNLKDDTYEKFINDLLEKEKDCKTLFEKNVEKLIMNIEDIILDIPNAESVFTLFVEFIESMNIYEESNIRSLKELIVTQVKLLEENEDDNFF